ncbi:adenylate/guanylate cyclase domain-containing protein [Ruegeria arenilitoris]|uniref:adenylate/guanylate cyclase domain-containing protein n=1 Tax=Ruegeria arenilitoris TaxID=1173585 RepID=UPI00147CFE8E|nr:adenylate/guanylate cyclase domain-containing protein [Ruegeria arenilitoris]
MNRRLSTILAADVVGYSTRMREDEIDTINRVTLLNKLIGTVASTHNGRVFNRAGDGFLLEFSSPVAAVRCAYNLQLQLAAPVTKREIGLEIRVGVHLADVVVDGDDLLGDGVNVASRIESEAEPGMVLVSNAVFDHAKRSAQLKFENKGTRNLKNISEPITVYAVAGELGTHSCGTALIEDSSLPYVAELQKSTNSIVVLPFKNMSNDPEQEYFSDGLTEDIITELSRFPDILTISRNTSFGLKGVAADARELGQKLGVRFCLEGGVRKLGNRIRINAYLTDAVSGEQLWTERADCNLGDLFDFQDDLVAKIVASVAGQIERQLEATAQRKRPGDLEAYECLIRGLYYHRIGGVTKENAEEAVHWFDEALKRDPGYGRVHAWRACAVATVAEWTGEDVWDELVEAGNLAVELDETDAESHRIAGSLALYVRDFERAKFHFNRALELNPNHAFIVGRTGELHNFLGDGKTALEYQKRAKMLDPFLPEYCRELEAIAYYVMHDFEACFNTVDEFARLTRRAAAYRTAAATHLNNDYKIERAVRDLLLHDPDFKPSTFIQTEYFKDREISKRLKAELRSAMATTSLRLAG